MAGNPPGPLYLPLDGLDANRIEPLDQYRQGGLHPILVGDILGGRYGVFDKLGHGQSSTVWLCLDRKSRGFKWCAVRVLTARVSVEEHRELEFYPVLRRLYLKGSHLSPPFHHFWIEGPNGRHLCLVSEVLGPSITDVLVTDPRDILFQAAESLQFLHQHGLCHGNLQPANIRFRLTANLRRVNEARIENILGPPRRETVFRLNDEAIQRGPRYIYQSKAFPIRQTDKIEIAVIDFSEAFNVDGLRPWASTLPLENQSPGVSLQLELDQGMDVWSLVTTIAGLRTGTPMFGAPDRDWHTLVQGYELHMGIMPVPYSEFYRLRQWEEQAPATLPPPFDPTLPVSMTLARYNNLMALHAEAFPGKDAFTTHTEGQHSILTRRPGLDDVNGPPRHRHDFTLGAEEVESLADLFRSSFRYDPDERLDLAGVMNHGYFEGRRSRIIREDPGEWRGYVDALEFALEHWVFCIFLLHVLALVFVYIWWRHREVVHGTCWAVPGWEYSCYFVKSGLFGSVHPY